MIETYENSKQYVLSGAYDLLPVNVILPEDMKEALEKLIETRVMAISKK